MLKYRLVFSNMLSFTSNTCRVVKGVRRGGVIANFRGMYPRTVDILQFYEGS